MTDNVSNDTPAQYLALPVGPAPSVMAGRRREARRLFAEGLRLPRRGDEGYEYTSVDDMFAPDLGLNINRVAMRADTASLFKCGVPNISSLSGITVNDIYNAPDTLRDRLPAGVTLTTFADPSVAGIVGRYFGAVADGARPEVAFNTMLAQDGLLLHVAAGVTVPRPIQLVNILDAIATPDGVVMPVLAVRRLLVVMERGASADVLVCDHDRAADGLSASSRVVEIVLGPEARLNYYELEEGSGSTSRLTDTTARLDAGSHLDLFSGTLKPGRTRNNFTIHLDAPGAELSLNGMAIVDSDRLADNSATVIHHAPRCTSNQMFKYIVSDNGRGAFEGLIRVDHGAHHTEAFQNDRNLLASPGARMHSRPQLEIYCDDVKCSHGAATGQLDARALFYMRSRGIDEPEARSMLMKAFMADVIDAIALEPLRDRLRHLVDMRLAGDDARCEGCNAC